MDKRNLSKPASAYYLGHTFEEIRNSGIDVLAHKIYQYGEPCLESIEGILPKVEIGKYYFLSGVATWTGLILYPNGHVMPQETAQDQHPVPLFTPMEEDPKLGLIQPIQKLEEGWIPVVTSTHKKDTREMQITYFVEYGDPDSNPQLWVRVDKSCYDDIDTRCYVISRSRPIPKRMITNEEFQEVKNLTIHEWRRLALGFDNFLLPENKIQIGIKAMMCNLFSTFSGDHAHYGHLYYGREIHDNFPPNYLSAIEICYMLGMKMRAYKMLEHLLHYCIDAKGRFYYRQGPMDLNGASGSEYGKFIWLIDRLCTSDPHYDLRPYLETIKKMGYFLLGQIKSVPEAGGRRLIIMCAEADTRSKIYAYTSNNLWCVNGLRSLGRILELYGDEEDAVFYRKADDLYEEVRMALDEHMVDSKFGPLVPFRMGYTATPLTLSNCKDCYYPISNEEYNTYLRTLDFDSESGLEQDYSENTYANYRYYPEMLSSGLLRKEEESAIIKLRENLGGELLGMTRFYERLDDWPAGDYARYLLTNDMIDKYLLLYYAHMQYHGNIETGVYYEQVTFDGQVFAPDCVPSVLLVPTMTAWMFCFEPVNEDSIYLFRAIPKKWFINKGIFSAKNLMTTGGIVTTQITVAESHIEIILDIEKLSDRALYMDIRVDETLTERDIQGENVTVISTPYKNRFQLFAMNPHMKMMVQLNQNI